MFFLHEMERTITLHPSFFGGRIHEYLTSRLMADVEGTNTGNFYIVCVMDAYDISEGRVVPGSAFAEYTVHYRAVVWRPFKGETLDGVVSSVVNNGFFVDVGPLTVFVSVQMIPSEIKFDGNATPPQFTDNADQIIEKGTHIRVKIKGIRGEVGQMYAIATIKEAAKLSLFCWKFDYTTLFRSGAQRIFPSRLDEMRGCFMLPELYGFLMKNSIAIASWATSFDFNERQTLQSSPGKQWTIKCDNVEVGFEDVLRRKRTKAESQGGRIWL